jgi:hypothetical protein
MPEKFDIILVMFEIVKPTDLTEIVQLSDC